MKLTITQTTYLKARPLQSTDLQAKEKIPITPGTVLDLNTCDRDRNHWRITFQKSINRPGIFFIYEGHCKIEGPTNKQGTSLDATIKLEVPYRSQLDNFLNPTGSCNVTSLAMCLDFLKISRREKSGQFEDELYRYAITKDYSRHEPRDLARIVRDYGATDKFTEWGTIERCKSHLASGNPCVIHGYFTSFGHIIVLVGYNSDGFLVHDPYGEWFKSGYDTQANGAYLNYSYDLIERTCIPDGQFWVHFISK
jgi:Peptidase_C39 like family